jgi:hypothetical protein
MKQPGFKVFHIPEIDFRSNSLTFRQCLEELKLWSAKHKNHYPVFITMNAKDDDIKRTDFTSPEKFTAEIFDALDKEIITYLGKENIIIPDQVRGKYNSLESAVTAGNWPSLKEARGKFIFILDETGNKIKTYVQNHPSLKGRVLFANAEPANRQWWRLQQGSLLGSLVTGLGRQHGPNAAAAIGGLLAADHTIHGELIGQVFIHDTLTRHLITQHRATVTPEVCTAKQNHFVGLAIVFNQFAFAFDPLIHRFTLLAKKTALPGQRFDDAVLVPVRVLAHLDAVPAHGDGALGGQDFASEYAELFELVMFQGIRLYVDRLFAVGGFSQAQCGSQQAQAKDKDNVFQGTKIAEDGHSPHCRGINTPIDQRPLRISPSRKSVICKARSMLPAKLPST